MAGGRRYGLRPTPQPPAIRVQGVGHFYFGGKHTKWVRFKSALTFPGQFPSGDSGRSFRCSNTVATSISGFVVFSERETVGYGRFVPQSARVVAAPFGVR